MSRSISIFGGAALAVAALLASGPAAYAQHHGGMSGGAFHGGGPGGFHGPGMGGSWGGYRGGYGYRGYGYGGYGYPGFGLYLGLGGYGGYYDYGSGGYAPSYYNYSPTYIVPPDGGAQTQSAYPPAAGAARLLIRTPGDAQVWVDDYKVAQTGPFRQLDTPSVLEPGKTYHYTVKAQWTDNGKAAVREQIVNVQAGQVSAVDFTQPATTSPDQIPAPTPNPVTPPAPTTPPASPTRG